MLSRIFNKLGEQTMYLGTAVPEAAFASALHYGHMALRFIA